MTHVLVVDRHPIVRSGLARLLTTAWPPLQVAGAGQADAALRLSRTERWNLIVMDVWLDPDDGLGLLQQLRAEAPRRPVLIFTSKHDPDVAIRAIRAGATGYVSKDTEHEGLLIAIKRVAAGRTFIPDWISETLALRLREDDDTPPHARLSDREFQVLRLLGSGCTGREAAATMHISHKTVATYRARLLDKLGLRNSVELAGYAVRHGLTTDPARSQRPDEMATGAM